MLRLKLLRWESRKTFQHSHKYTHKFKHTNILTEPTRNSKKILASSAVASATNAVQIIIHINKQTNKKKFNSETQNNRQLTSFKEKSSWLRITRAKWIKLLNQNKIQATKYFWSIPKSRRMNMIRLPIPGNSGEWSHLKIKLIFCLNHFEYSNNHI